jgi:hypothetical protein
MGILSKLLGGGVIQAKIAAFDSKKREAMRDLLQGQGIRPSWVTDELRQEQFVTVIRHLAHRKSVPHSFISETLHDVASFKALVHFAGALEQRKASFSEQQMAVAEFLTQLWGKLDRDRKALHLKGNGA